MLEGKIYAIRSPNTNKIYIGSTCQDLNKRFNGHKHSNTTTSQEIINSGQAYIELIQNYNCNNKIELRLKEGQIIKENREIAVNSKVAGTTLAESQKIYRSKHREWYQNYISNWNKENKDKIKIYNIRRKEKKNKLKEDQKQAEKIKEQLI